MARRQVSQSGKQSASRSPQPRRWRALASGQFACHPAQVVDLAVQHHPIAHRFKHAVTGKRHGARQGGERFGQIGQRVKPDRPAKTCWQDGESLDAIEPERTPVLAQVAIADGVPVAFPKSQSVGIDLAFSLHLIWHAVAQPHTLLWTLGRDAQCNEDFRIARRVGALHVQGDDFANGAHALAQVLGHDALELGKRTGAGRCRLRQAKIARGEQTERQRFIVAEHHRRQLETLHQPIAAVAATVGQHRDAQRFERNDIAAYRAHSCAYARSSRMYASCPSRAQAR
nr:hypothetical protein [Massilia frigida]